MIQREKQIKAALAVALLICLLPISGSAGVYYELVRFLAMVGFSVLAWSSFKQKQEGLLIVYFVLALLFNPFLPLRLGRVLWNVIDVAIAIWLLYTLFEAKRQIAISPISEKETTKSKSPSPIFVDCEYRIFLPENNNLEIVLTPLPKALYLLYLNHPEGIAFKNLPEHRPELISIYKKLATREDDLRIEQSIDDLVNPLHNSVNEKASRIKEAFCKQLPDEVAQHYYLTGGRGEAKRIRVCRQAT